MKRTPTNYLAAIDIETIWEKAKLAKPTSLSQLARVCAIPHWFNKELAQALTGCNLDDAERLAKRYPSFIRDHPRGYTYHESVRLAFWQKWHVDADQELKQISARLVMHLEHQIDRLSYPERLDYEYECLYHLTTVDPDRGFERLDKLFQTAQDNHQIEACHRLVKLMSEHHDYLPEDFRIVLRYYEGEVERELHHQDRAKSVFSEILSSQNAGELTRAKANNSMALSIISGQANLDDAFPFLMTSLDILRKLDNQYWLGQVLYNLSYVSRLAGRREAAYNFGEEALALLNAGGDSDDFNWLVKKSRVLSELGLVLWLLGKPDEARKRFNEALAIQMQVGAQDPAIETHTNLGRLERTSGNWDEAIRQLQNAIQIATETENYHQMAWTKNALGNVYVEKQDWAAALHCFEESRDLWENIGHQHERGVPVKNLIGVYTVLGKWDLAENAAQDSLNIFASHEGRQGEIYNSVGELRFAQKRYAEARESFERALGLADKSKDRKTGPRILINLAQVDLIEGNLKLARQECEKALQQSRTYLQFDRAAQSYAVLGKIELLENNMELAANSFLSARDQASTFNPQVYKIILSQITCSILEVRHDRPDLEWSIFFGKIAATQDGSADEFVLAILKLEKEPD